MECGVLRSGGEREHAECILHSSSTCIVAYSSNENIHRRCTIGARHTHIDFKFKFTSLWASSLRISFAKLLCDMREMFELIFADCSQRAYFHLKQMLYLSLERPYSGVLGACYQFICFTAESESNSNEHHRLEYNGMWFLSLFLPCLSRELWNLIMWKLCKLNANDERAQCVACCRLDFRSGGHVPASEFNWENSSAGRHFPFRLTLPSIWIWIFLRKTQVIGFN